MRWAARSSLITGAGEKNRTSDLHVTSALLHKLSYPSKSRQGYIRGLTALPPAIFRHRKRLRAIFNFVQQQLGTRQRHGHAIAEMSGVGIQIGTVRMAADGRDVVRRAWPETRPMPDRFDMLPGGEDLAHPSEQAVAGFPRDGFVEAHILERAAHQHMAITARDEVQVLLEQDVLQRRRVEFEQQDLPAYRSDIHVQGMLAQQGFAPRTRRHDIRIRAEFAARGLQRGDALATMKHGVSRERPASIR